MPTFPLPPLANGVPLDGGTLPVSSTADVSAEWAAELQAAPIAPLRDAIQDGQAAVLLAYQRASRYAAAQSDPGRATDEYEDECAEERGVFRQPSEANGALRTRTFARKDVVSMDAIVAAANAILAPYTAVSCRYAEASDGWFVGDGETSWSSHVFASADGGTAAATPNYPDRLYPTATPTGLASLPNRRPPGAMPNVDTAGRWFLLRVPDISLIDSEIASVFDGTQNEPVVGGFFVGSGTNPADLNVTYVFNFSSTTVDGVYSALVSAVTAIVGQGIRWDMIVDPLLSA